MRSVRESIRGVLRGSGEPYRERHVDGGKGEPLEEILLRVEIPGATGVPVDALVPRKALSDIVEGGREMVTRLRVRDHSYGWRDLNVLVLPREEGEPPGRGSRGQTRRVMQEIPGYGRVPMKMAFLENPGPNPDDRPMCSPREDKHPVAR